MWEAGLHYVKTLLSKFGILCYLRLQAFNSHKARDMRTNVSQPPWSVVVMWLAQSNEMWVEMGAICKPQHLINAAWTTGFLFYHGHSEGHVLNA